MYKYDISVIIPIYNAAPYLSEAIESILHQTKSGIEIILVDDGSTDGSAEMIDDYSRQHDNIFVKHQKNSGVEKARAEGYLMARGKYIGWIDADDIAKPDMFEKLFDLAEQKASDYVYCNYEFFPQEVSTKTKWFKEYKGQRDGDFIDRNTQCWNTLVRHELYEQVQIDKLLLEYSEYCWIAAMLEAETIEYTQEKLYRYRVGHASISGGQYKGKVKYYQKGVSISKGLKKLIRGTQYEQSLDSYFDYRYIYTLLLLLIVAAKNSDKEVYKETKKELNNMQFRKNPYLDRFVANNYGKLKAWVVTRILPINYYIANPIVRITL